MSTPPLIPPTPQWSWRFRLLLAVPLLAVVAFLLIQWGKYITRDSVPPVGKTEETASAGPAGPVP